MIAPSADGCKRLVGSRRPNPKSFLVASEAQSSDWSGKWRLDFTTLVELVEDQPDDFSGLLIGCKPTEQSYRFAIHLPRQSC